eukprot:scaffold308927_cov17-Tisochrysis_lutea.AAC.1
MGTSICESKKCCKYQWVSTHLANPCEVSSLLLQLVKGVHARVGIYGGTIDRVTPNHKTGRADYFGKACCLGCFCVGSSAPTTTLVGQCARCDYGRVKCASKVNVRQEGKFMMPPETFGRGK